ncbi:hypothetical protein MW887_003621 [Aspergillus wentii]|nr:hypothetical protein MW887_003621 [Aspergillus wentii]
MASENNIPLVQMPQQAGVRQPEDDWTGVIDRTERRKLQNRLNQRTYRLRRRLERSEQEQLTAAMPIRVTKSDMGFVCTSAPPHADMLMRQLETMAYTSYITNSPQTDHLLTLSKVGVQRAIIENTRSIGMTMEWMKDDNSISIFNLLIPGFSEGNIPVSLRPTEMQRRIPHHPWLDFFPFPTFRDNLIAVQDDIDDEDLCHDLMAFWDTHNTRATMLVWGQPWDPANWEMTEAFLDKWGFLLVGCDDLFRSSNYWRAQRGEKALTWRLH